MYETFLNSISPLAFSNLIAFSGDLTLISASRKFETLTNSLSDGIPAEQAAQQKRYEYYRDLLLTFPRKEV